MATLPAKTLLLIEIDLKENRARKMTPALLPSQDQLCADHRSGAQPILAGTTFQTCFVRSWRSRVLARVTVAPLFLTAHVRRVARRQHRTWPSIGRLAFRPWRQKLEQRHSHPCETRRRKELPSTNTDDWDSVFWPV